MRSLNFRSLSFRSLSFRALNSAGSLSGVWTTIVPTDVTWTRL